MYKFKVQTIKQPNNQTIKQTNSFQSDCLAQTARGPRRGPRRGWRDLLPSPQQTLLASEVPRKNLQEPPFLHRFWENQPFNGFLLGTCQLAPVSAKWFSSSELHVKKCQETSHSSEERGLPWERRAPLFSILISKESSPHKGTCLSAVPRPSRRLHHLLQPSRRRVPH